MASAGTMAFRWDLLATTRIQATPPPRESGAEIVLRSLLRLAWLLVRLGLNLLLGLVKLHFRQSLAEATRSI